MPEEPNSPQRSIQESINRVRDSIYYNLNLTNIPEFKGAPQENIDEFLKEFKRVTSSFSNDQRCHALKRALIGDAAIYAKIYLKKELTENNWKEVKNKLRKRFLLIDIELKNRTELRRMVYNKNSSTLLGYVDRYASLYRKVHSKAKDSELIGDLSLNLGQDLVRKLNQLSANWQTDTEFENFRTLIARLERDIIALEPERSTDDTKNLTSTVNQIVVAALEQPLKDIKTILAKAVKKPEEQPEPIEVLAAIQHSRDSRNYERRDNYEVSKRKDRPWESSNRAQKEPYKYRRYSNPEKERLNMAEELKKEYESRYGTPRGGCFVCRGFHFQRHCPLYNIQSLKD